MGSHDDKVTNFSSICLQAEAVNVLATEAIAKGAKKLGAKVVFYSSDYVFDGVNSKSGVPRHRAGRVRLP